MKEYRGVIDKIAAFCFTIALGAYVMADKFVTPLFASSQPLLHWLSLIILALSSLGLFDMIFKGLLWIYQKYIHVRLFQPYYLSGVWHHIMIVEPEKSVRYGTTYIRSDVDGISLTGEVFRGDGSYSSAFQSEATVATDRRLVVMYVSETVSRPQPISRGGMVLSIISIPPKQFSGTWNDMAPSTKRGRIIFFQDENSYQQELRKFLPQSNSVSI